MFKLVFVFTLAALGAAQKSHDYMGASGWHPSAAFEMRAPLPVEVAPLGGKGWAPSAAAFDARAPLPMEVAPLGTPDWLPSHATLDPLGRPIDIAAPLPVGPAALPLEVAPLGAPVVTSAVAPEVINFPAPAAMPAAPLINLPKGAPDVVDVPHNNIVMPGDKLENKDLLLNLPSPNIEGPHPILKPKDVLIRFPQDIFEVPKPSIQLKPVLHKVPLTTRILTPKVNLREFLFKVPSAQITGKSGYVQPLPTLL